MTARIKSAYNDRRKQVVTKKCRRCGRTMRRRRLKDGTLERASNFISRQFCGKACRLKDGARQRADPTPEEIRALSLEIQAGWSREVEARRRVIPKKRLDIYRASVTRPDGRVIRSRPSK